MDFKLSSLEDMQYVTVYPKDYKSTDKYPVIIFLHGAGTRGTNTERLKNKVFFNRIHQKNLLGRIDAMILIFLSKL